MRDIRIMSKELANKIAAGEVVERPGSVVKELTENCIDAGATAVTVEIKDGGLSYIRVTDNGCGIPAEQAETAFLRHSTSKMYNDDELGHIQSLGFRGEALASIAAVSKLRMLTRTAIAQAGAEVELEGGEVIKNTAAGCPCGTTITVKNLFYNTPARLRFTKKPAQEAAYIGDIISRLILAKTGISFKYIVDGRIALHSPGDFDGKNAISAVYGRECAQNVLEVDYTAGNLHIYGYIGNSELEKNNRSYQSLFINGRYIRDALVSNAVQGGYLNRIMVGKFPFFVLYIDMPFDEVDVNVHPNKLEVRFANEQQIAQAVTQAVRNALQVDEIPPLIQQEQTDDGKDAFTANVTRMEPQEIKLNFGRTVGVTAAESNYSARLSGFESARLLSGTKTEPAQKQMPATAPAWANNAPPQDVNTAKNAVKTNDDAENGCAKRQEHEQITLMQTPAAHKQREFLERYKLVGQLFCTYAVLEYNDSVYLIDQHAAHERLLYERLVNRINGEDVTSQMLMQPVVLDLNYTELALLDAVMPDLIALGYEIEPFGEHSRIVRSVPVLMGQMCGADFITSLLNDKEFTGITAAQVRKAKLMQAACKHAVKGGDALTDKELLAIIDMINTEGVPLSCPHGRPILVALTKHELEVRFKRIQQ